jgi:hypothetical protein
VAVLSRYQSIQFPVNRGRKKCIKTTKAPKRRFCRNGLNLLLIFLFSVLVPVEFQKIMHIVPAAANHGKGNGKQSRAFGESRLFEEKTAVKKSERNSVRDHDRKINLSVF